MYIPFEIASRRRSVLNPDSHSCKMSTPAAINIAHPNKLKNKSILLLMGVPMMYPKNIETLAITINRKIKLRKIFIYENCLYFSSGNKYVSNNIKNLKY